VAEFDPNTPAIARVYDYILGGKDNFAADRELAQYLIDVFPPITVTARENKQFLDRAVGWLATQGIGQFIDLGCGMPTSPGTHESARLAAPGARVAYVDTDPIVLSHLHGLPAREQAGLTIVDGDVRDVPAVLGQIADGIDLSAPACVIMAALLHFFPVEAGRALVARYTAALVPGSYLILTMGLAFGPDADRFFARYNEGPNRLYQHSAADFASFFGDLPLLSPGVVDGRAWRPGWPQVPVPPKRDAIILVGVAQIPDRPSGDDA
jgi:O-methyltransferase involved in polyketide biosynthesis